MKIAYTNAIGLMNMNTALPKISVLYARAATTKQGEKNSSLSKQLYACQEKANELGHKIFARYNDVSSGRTTSERPGLERLLKDSRRYKFDYVIVSNIDRLARKVAEYYKLKEQLKQSGTQIISCEQPDISNNPLLESISIGLAQYVSEEHSLRTKRGIQERKRALNQGVDKLSLKYYKGNNGKTICYLVSTSSNRKPKHIRIAPENIQRTKKGWLIPYE